MPTAAKYKRPYLPITQPVVVPEAETNPVVPGTNRLITEGDRLLEDVPAVVSMASKVTKLNALAVTVTG